MDNNLRKFQYSASEFSLWPNIFQLWLWPNVKMQLRPFTGLQKKPTYLSSNIFDRLPASVGLYQKKVENGNVVFGLNLCLSKTSEEMYLF